MNRKELANRKDVIMHVRLRSSEKTALETLAEMRGADLSKLVRETLVEVCVVAGLLLDPAANLAGKNCAVCGSMTARPVELPNGSTFCLCQDCAPFFGVGERQHATDHRHAVDRGSRVLAIGEGAR